MSDNRDELQLLPASLPEAPRSEEYNVDLRPEPDELDPRDREIVLPDQHTVTVAYTAGPDAPNAGEAMVARGPANEVRDVLNRAGYLARTSAEAARLDDMKRTIVEIAQGIDVEVREVEDSAYEVRLASADAVEAVAWNVIENADEQQTLTSALASGLWQLIQEDKQNEKTDDGPVIDGTRTVKLGNGTYRLYLGSDAARSTLKRAASEVRHDRAQVVQAILRSMLALQLMSKRSKVGQRLKKAQRDERERKGEE